MKSMSQSTKSLSAPADAFWLNPNVVAKMRSGFKACLARPFEIREPEPEFALTVPGELASLPDATDAKDWH